MDVLIITVAGTSSRFAESIGRDVLKCIYTGGEVEETLLFRQLSLSSDFDRILIVGGYKFDELTAYISEEVPEEIKKKITLIENPHYEDRGSGWSLYLAVDALKGKNIDSIVFAEGDLYFDEASFIELCRSGKDSISCNSHLIDASKSVVFYCDKESHPHYVYDTSHGSIEIKEPFTRIYNSGQVWKFSDPDRLFELSDQITEDIHSKTNLELINRYFCSQSICDLEIIEFEVWINCNTVDDYEMAFGGSRYAY